MFKWQGRIDNEDGLEGLRWHQKVDEHAYRESGNLTSVNNSDKRATIDNTVTLVGFESDLGVAFNKGRTGAAAGPNAIRQALSNLPWHWPNTSFTDLGNVTAVDNLAQAQTQYADAISYALKQHTGFTIGLGGGHEIAWGSYQGLFNTKPENARIGIINFDAHFDLRKPALNTSSGTPFRQVYDHCQLHNTPFYYACLGVSKAANTAALFNFANVSNTRYLTDIALNDESLCMQRIDELLSPMLKDIDALYVTICLDAFSAAQAPGVSAPSALGISPTLVINTLHFLAQHQSTYGYQWRLCDVAEMNPNYDIDSRTAKLAARLIFEAVDAVSLRN